MANTSNASTTPYRLVKIRRYKARASKQIESS